MFNFNIKSKAANCLNYMHDGFKKLKSSFEDYQAHASGYDPYVYMWQANTSDYNFFYNPPIKTQSIERLLNLYVPPKDRIKTLATNIADNLTYTLAYGAFALANLIVSEKKSIEGYVCPKELGYFDNEAYNDACSTDILSRATLIDENGTEYPKAVDDSWGFVDECSLSVDFKNTNPPPKPPRRLTGLFL